MKSVCSLLLALLALVALSAAAEQEKPYWAELQVISGKPFRVYGYYEKMLEGSRCGYFVLTEVESDGYRQGYAGPQCKLTDWLQIGIGVGHENMPNAFRRAAFVEIDAEKISALVTVENGGSGPWHNATIAYKPIPSFGIGAKDETGLGRGPRLEVNDTKNGLQFWGARLHEKSTTWMFGINASF